MIRTCKKCRKEKSLEDFTANKLCKFGREHSCKECTITRQGAWEHLRPESHLNSYLKYRHGLTKKDYDALYMKQQGRCAICNNYETARTKTLTDTKRLCVDHDHNTGAIRELLCTLCNTSLGALKEDISRLEAMIEYIKKHKNRPK